MNRILPFHLGIGFAAFILLNSGEIVSDLEMRQWSIDPEYGRDGKFERQSPALNAQAELKETDEIQNASYALTPFEIVKKGNGAVLWKRCGTHSRVNIGRGFIMEDILFIGHSEIGTSTMLKKQFHDHLRSLPEWCDTRYYTFHDAIRECY